MGAVNGVAKSWICKNQKSGAKRKRELESDDPGETTGVKSAEKKKCVGSVGSVAASSSASASASASSASSTASSNAPASSTFPLASATITTDSKVSKASLDCLSNDEKMLAECRDFLLCPVKCEPMCVPVELPCGHVMDYSSLLAYDSHNVKKKQCPICLANLPTDPSPVEISLPHVRLLKIVYPNTKIDPSIKRPLNSRKLDAFERLTGIRSSIGTMSIPASPLLHELEKLEKDKFASERNTVIQNVDKMVIPDIKKELARHAAQTNYAFQLKYKLLKAVTPGCVKAYHDVVLERFAGSCKTRYLTSWGIPYIIFDFQFHFPNVFE